ncbi:MAG: Uma2 family endonuclease [Pseudonocardia sp.]|nr:Uma2 family endonuclease [Pseudonocardia sp.]
MSQPVEVDMTTTAPPEERIVLRRVRWDTYERLVADHEDARSPRFTYDRGVLEIMSPGSWHESIADLVRAMMNVIAETRDIDMTGLGSTTFKDAGWDRGFEPDACFYLEHAARVRGLRRIVPRVDPAPEIVFEVDITSGSIDKMALYARFGVPEVWRHDGTAASIHVLDGEGYRQQDASAAVAGLDAEALTRLLADGLRTPLPRWLREVRAWAEPGQPS